MMTHPASKNSLFHCNLWRIKLWTMVSGLYQDFLHLLNFPCFNAVLFLKGAWISFDYSSSKGRPLVLLKTMKYFVPTNSFWLVSTFHGCWISPVLMQLHMLLNSAWILYDDTTNKQKQFGFWHWICDVLSSNNCFWLVFRFSQLLDFIVSM